MKYYYAFFFAFVLLSGCLSLNKSILSDSEPDNNSSLYHTYFISSNNELPPELSISLESVISSRLDALGYHQSNETPDLLINYKIYEHSFSTSILEVLQTKEMGNESKLRRYKFKNGAIYITFFSKKLRRVVWRGFIDGSSLNPRIVKAKTYEIMDHYKNLATPEKKVAALN